VCVQVGVVCGSLVGLLLTRRLVVRMADSREVSPTEFEREGGKGSSKKWKVRAVPQSIHQPAGGLAREARLACVLRCLKPELHCVLDVAVTFMKGSACAAPCSGSSLHRANHERCARKYLISIRRTT
jgi:SAND domain